MTGEKRCHLASANSSTYSLIFFRSLALCLRSKTWRKFVQLSVMIVIE